MNVTAALVSDDFLRKFSEVAQNRDVDTNQQSYFGGAAFLDVHTHREHAARWRPRKKG